MPSQKLLILGYGMQGKAALYDCLHCGDFESIVVADSAPDFLKSMEKTCDPKMRGVNLDASDTVQVRDLIAKADVVIDALPAEFTVPIGKLTAEAGVHVVSSMYYLNPGVEKPQALAKLKEDLGYIDRTAKENDCTILTEFGLDPGLDLIVGAEALREVDEVEVFNSYGAGFPTPDSCGNALSYKFTWSVKGALLSYKRPAKIIKDGQIVEIPGMEMFAPENMHIIEDECLGGPLECFPNGNSVKYAEEFGIAEQVKEMGRFICRRPGHGEFWWRMANSGFLSEEPVKIGDAEVAPIDFVSALFQSQKQFWYSGRERDTTLIRVEVQGKKDGKNKSVIYQMVDYKDLETGFTSMQRTVGFTMGIGAMLLVQGKLNTRGMISPTQVPLDLIEPELKKRNITLTRIEACYPKRK